MDSQRPEAVEKHVAAPVDKPQRYRKRRRGEHQVGDPDGVRQVGECQNLSGALKLDWTMTANAKATISAAVANAVSAVLIEGCP